MSLPLGPAQPPVRVRWVDNARWNNRFLEEFEKPGKCENPIVTTQILSRESFGELRECGLSIGPVENYDLRLPGLRAQVAVTSRNQCDNFDTGDVPGRHATNYPPVT